MDMTFQQYIDNPMGKKNAVFSQRDVFKKIYTEKFEKVFLREAGKIDFTLYVDKKKDQYIAHIKVPSETVKEFYYDVVILFYSNDGVAKASPSLQNYNVKFFSNDPAFIFTYLRVFLKNDLFFEDLKPKASKLALTKDPKERNPYEVPGYSKIIYFAYLFMKNKNLFSKHMYSTYGHEYSAKKLLATVEHTDKKIEDRTELGKKQTKDEAKKKAETATINNRTIVGSSGVSNGKMTPSVNRISKTKTSATTSRSKTTQKIKRK